MAGILLLQRDDIVLGPIRDMSPMPLGLIWHAAHENPRIRVDHMSRPVSSWTFSSSMSEPIAPVMAGSMLRAVMTLSHLSFPYLLS